MCKARENKIMFDIKDSKIEGQGVFASEDIKKINDTKKFNLDDESLFMEFENKVLDG